MTYNDLETIIADAEQGVLTPAEAQRQARILAARQGLQQPPATAPPVPAEEPWRQHVQPRRTTTDHQLAVSALVRDGASELEAHRIISATGGDLTPYAGAIKAAREKAQADAEQAARLAWERGTIEGRLAVADRLGAEQQEAERMAASGRLLLEAHGISTEGMDTGEVIDAAFTKPVEAEAERLAASDLNANLAAAGWTEDD